MPRTRRDQAPPPAAENTFLRRSVELALDNVRTSSGGPFGAVVVCQGRIIAEGTNQVTSSSDPTAHAEIVAIRAACRRLRRFHLLGCDLYASCEPCPMCLGAIYWARLERVFFAASRADAAAVGFLDAELYQELVLPPSERRIPALHLPCEEALAPFEAWKTSPRKIWY